MTYPEVRDCFNHYKGKVDEAYTQQEEVWNQYKDVESQKDFALSIQGKTPFTGILFTTRKNKSALKDEWRKAELQINKTLFK